MKIDFKPYSNYKKSKFDYIGKLPEHWAEKRVKFLTPKVRTGTTPSSNGPDFFSDGEIFWYNPGDFTFENIKLNESKKKLNKNFFEESNTNKYPAGSVLIVGIGATLGKVGLAKKESYSNQQINAILPSDKYDSTFLAYTLFCYTDTLKVYSNATTLGIMNQEKTKNFNIPYPNIKEQTQIAAFLDQKTAQIDKLIAQKEKLLKLLAEKRTAIITQAVTKGLDPNVEMKDSGIDWLGKIPKHWGVKRFKFCLTEPLKYGANEAAESSDPDQPRFVRITDVDENGNLRDETFRSIDAEIAEPFLLQEGDLLMARSGATVGKNFMYKSNWGTACFAGYLIRARLNQEIVLPEFGNLFLTSGAYWDWVNSIFIQSTIQNISAEKYANFVLAIPTIEEQQKIVAYAMNKRVQLGNIIDGITVSLIKLKEYREALITAAVTGQIDVRKEASHE